MHTSSTQKIFGKKFYIIINKFNMILNLDFGGDFLFFIYEDYILGTIGNFKF